MGLLAAIQNFIACKSMHYSARAMHSCDFCVQQMAEVAHLTPPYPTCLNTRSSVAAGIFGMRNGVWRPVPDFFQLLEMGIEYPYATGGALAGPLPGPRFDYCVIIFRSILLCKVPCSILILTNAGARGPTKENAYRFSSFQAP